MYWQDTALEPIFTVPDDVVDLSFRVRCAALPVDHAYALWQALRNKLAWLDTERVAGIHTIHGAASGNGWRRPREGGLLQLSRRTRLVLRLPHERVSQAQALSGASLRIAGFDLRIGESRVRPLSPLTTLFARQVACDPRRDEAEFLARVVADLKAAGVDTPKLLCGRERHVATPDGPIQTRSLMLADLKTPGAVLLQQHGLGPHRQLGCGLFVPHKSVDAVATAGPQ